MILRATLPPGIERLRRASIRDEIVGVPAHLTMLHPFVAPVRLDSATRRRLAAVAAGIDPFEYRLLGLATWPGAVYVAVDPVSSFIALQARLAAAFPAFPIYGADPGFDFVPHVTIVEGPSVLDSGVVADPAWRSLPRAARARSIEVIARPTDAPWRTIWRLPLGRMQR